MRLIDADALIPMMKYATTDSEIGVFPIKIGFNEIEKVINEQPTIEAERKTGRWIHDGYAFKGGIDWMHCSECGHKDCWSAATRTPFCAWCGARMEEPEDIPMEYFESGGK